MRSMLVIVADVSQLRHHSFRKLVKGLCFHTSPLNSAAIGSIFPLMPLTGKMGPPNQASLEEDRSERPCSLHPKPKPLAEGSCNEVLHSSWWGLPVRRILSSKEEHSF